VDCSAWGGMWPTDCLRSTVVKGADRRYRLYGLRPSCWQDLQADVQQRASAKVASLPSAQVVSVAQGAIVAAEAWDEAQAGLPGLPAASPEDELERLDLLVAACRILHQALTPLHEAGFVWLNFDPNHLEIQGLRITGSPNSAAGPRFL
jgi:hypothetical protein